MSKRAARLKKVLAVQEKITSLHRARQAAHIAQARAAADEALALVGAFDGETSLSGLFPELYHRRIERAEARRGEELLSADREARNAITATLREDMLRRDLVEVRRADERQTEEKERAEAVTRHRPQRG